MLVPVVLSGGKGTRLWPVSREAYPKPFMRLFGSHSLLQETFLRARMVADVPELVCVTNKEYYFISRDEAGCLQGAEDCRVRFLMEPAARNTAPAIALATLHVHERHGDEARLLIMPSDHLVLDREAFAVSVKQASEAAAAGRLVTFGIRPKYPETGYGYIEAEAGGGAGVVPVKRFVEKPDHDTAVQYVKSGNFFWNSGMFCFSVRTMLEELERHAPQVLEAARAAYRACEDAGQGDALQVPAEEFARAESISIDYAVMEKSDRVSVLPVDFGWSDIGSWEAISGIMESDSDGNSVHGEAVLIETENTFIRTEHRLVAAVGVQDLVIVDTPDALLVGRRDRSQLVKEVVSQLEKQGHESHKLHTTVHRPWGTYTVISDAADYKIKRLEVKPGAALSLQMHHHRSEHWVVVSGVARVTNGEKVFDLQPNESTFIPAGNKHRLENPGAEPVVIIETQTGSYLGEDDIVRFEDRYGRSHNRGRG